MEFSLRPGRIDGERNGGLAIKVFGSAYCMKALPRNAGGTARKECGGCGDLKFKAP